MVVRLNVRWRCKIANLGSSPHCYDNLTLRGSPSLRVDRHRESGGQGRSTMKQGLGVADHCSHRTGGRKRWSGPWIFGHPLKMYHEAVLKSGRAHSRLQDHWLVHFCSFHSWCKTTTVESLLLTRPRTAGFYAILWASLNRRISVGDNSVYEGLDPQTSRLSYVLLQLVWHTFSWQVVCSWLQIGLRTLGEQQFMRSRAHERRIVMLLQNQTVYIAYLFHVKDPIELNLDTYKTCT